LLSDIPTPAQTSNVRVLQAVVIGLGVLFVIALVLVAFGIFRKVSASGRAAAPSTAVFALPPGGKIVEMQSGPNRLILRVRTKQGEEVDIVDTDNGHLVARIR
jgi:hypothetical protein